MPERLLIVEDEESITFAMTRYFRRHGFEVDSAHAPEEARVLLAAAHYAVVIADLRLGGVYGAEGLEIVSYVRECSPGTRTILLTAYNSPELEATAHARGADAVLRKPKPLSELAETVRTLLDRRP